MAALPKKKISRTRGRTRRAHNGATLTSLVKSTKFPGLSVPHRFRKYFDSLTATDKAVVRASGAGRKSLVSQTVKPKATTKVVPKSAPKVATKATTSTKRTSAAKTGSGK